MDLQFPTIPPGQSAPADEGDPYAKLLAMLAIKTGDWHGAKEALDIIPYDDLVNTCTELDKMYKEQQAKHDAPTPGKPTGNPPDPAKLELIRQKVNAIHQGSVNPVSAAEQRAIEAIKMAQREGMQPGS